MTEGAGAGGNGASDSPRAGRPIATTPRLLRYDGARGAFVGRFGEVDADTVLNDVQLHLVAQGIPPSRVRAAIPADPAWLPLLGPLVDVAVAMARSAPPPLDPESLLNELQLRLVEAGLPPDRVVRSIPANPDWVALLPRIADAARDTLDEDNYEPAEG